MPRKELQLAGSVCLLVAAKSEEIYAPPVDNLLYLCDNIYTKQQLFTMENVVLGKLNFNLQSPTVHTCLSFLLEEYRGDFECMVWNKAKKLPKHLQSHTFAEADDPPARPTYAKQTVGCFSKKARLLACYLAEMTLIDYHLVKYQPSVVATAIACLALHCEGISYNAVLVDSKHSMRDVAEVAAYLETVQKQEGKLKGVAATYGKKSMMEVASVPLAGGFVEHMYGDAPVPHLPLPLPAASSKKAGSSAASKK